MKTKITMVLAIFFSLYSFGQVGTVFKSGSLNYKITAATTVEVGENSGIIGAITIPSTVSYNSVNYQVKSIGLGAFQNNLSLSSITVPSSVTSIGQGAFLFCSGLSSVSLGNSVTSIGNTAFQDCTRLTSLTIPNSVTSIGNSAFLNCSGLTSVTIGTSVTTIGVSAFQECSRLTSVTIPNSVTSIGNSAFILCTGLTSVSLGSAVTSIGNFAFSETGLVSITIPNKVTSIGNNAFSRCSNLTSFVIGNSVATIGNYAFWYCTSLTSITIPNSVTNIGSNSFQSCSNLTSVTLGNSITSIGDFSFTGCTSLTSFTVNWTTPLTINANIFNGLNLSTKTLNVPAGLVAAYDAAAVWTDFNPIVEVVVLNQTFTSNGINYIVTKATLPYKVSVGSNTSFVGAATIPASVTNAGNSFAVTNIGTYAFRNCTGLTSVTIPNSVLFIDESAFSLCTSLTSVSLGSAVIDIGRHAFSGCSSLSSITIPNSVTRIFAYAFRGCTGLTSVSIPNSVTGISDFAFADCTGLISVTIPNSVTGIGASAFYYCSALTSVAIPNSVTSIESATFNNCTSLTSVTIPDSVTSIGEYAFGNCTGLTSVAIPNTVTSIGASAFYYCSALTSVAIPNTVTSIGDWSFYDCSALTSVAIPNTVTSIGDYAFGRCTSLTSVTVNWTTPLGISSTVFSGLDLPNIILNVPAETAATYDAASIWTNFNPIVEPVIVSLYTAIPDTNFEQALFDQGIDTVNGDHQVLTSAISGITSLYVSSESISSLVGIQAFTSLTDLYCSNNLLTSLDVSGLNNLSTLYCNENKLTALNLSGCSSLQSLNCRYNYLPALNFSSTPNLIYLVCGGNQFTSLNVTSLTNLNLLDCGKFHLDNESFSTGLDLINLDSYLIDNYAFNTPISSLTIAGLANLAIIYSSGNNLTSLNLTGLTSLSILKSQNNISSINLSGLSNLTYIDLMGNPLTSLNISGLNNLDKAYLAFTNLTTLNASGLTHLTQLTVSENPNLTSLNITGCSALVHLDCRMAKLSSLNFTGCSSLKTLDCEDNILTSLNLSGLTALEWVNCYNYMDVPGSRNQITTINLKGATNLTFLSCYGNLLTTLNLSGLTNLVNLDCHNNTNLSCIIVSDPVAAATNANWVKDATANYSKNCGGVSGTTEIQASQCGRTLSSLSTSLVANSVSGATNYRFKVVGNGNEETMETAVRYFYLKSLTAGAFYNTTYTISVATKHNGVWGEYGNECTITTPTGKTKIQSTQCGITLSSLSTGIVANSVSGATNYRFKVVGNGNEETMETAVRYFYLKSLNGGTFYNTSYTISVATKYNGVWGEYGNECTVTTPIAPATKIQATQCGMTLAYLSTTINANAVSGATNYIFKVVANGITQTIETIGRSFHLTSLPNGTFHNTAYTISVATKYNGVWGEYGDECTVRTPSGKTKIQSTQCGQTLASLSSGIVANSVSGATNYHFKVVANNGTPEIIETVARIFYLKSLIAGAFYNTTYTISVATKYNGVWGEYGDECTVRTPFKMMPNAKITANAIISKKIVSNEISVKMYPNPFTNNFKLDFISSSEDNVEISIYDMIGRQIENHHVISSEINNLELGNNYPSGVYNVVVTQGTEVKTLRVIKR